MENMKMNANPRGVVGKHLLFNKIKNIIFETGGVNVNS